MTYVTEWERLGEALHRVMDAGRSKEQAQIALGQAIADGVVKIRGKLKRRMTTHMTASDTVLEGAAFRIPPKIDPRDLEYEQSRPVKPWAVQRGAFEPSGFWELEWIELFRTDVTKAMCSPSARAPARTQLASKEAPARSRTRPALERAEQVIKLLYPEALPGQATVPNAILCRRAGEKLRELGLPDVSDDTILRAAGRRK
jgi:hypothetical protein